MSDSVLEIIDRMLRFRRARLGTQGRFSRDTPDPLERFQTRLEVILESYGKFSPTAYKTHCVRDQGVDIVVRSDNEGDAAPSLIGFQLKSTWDLLQADYMQKLKAQHFESQNIRGMEYYYIVLCVDEKSNERRIRMIENEFKNAVRTKIIEPEYVDTFLSLDQQRVDSYIKRVFAAGDVVLKKALDVVTFPSRTTGALAAYLAIQQYVVSTGSISIEQLKQAPQLRAFHARLSSGNELINQSDESEQSQDAADVIEFDEIYSDFEDQLMDDLEALWDNLIEIDGDKVTVELEQIAPLVALGLEALVRFEYEKNDIVPYLWDLLGLG